MGIFKRFTGKKSIKPGKLTKREKRNIYDIPLTDDTDILLTAKMQRFTRKKKTRKTSDSYGNNVTHFGDKKLSNFLDEVGIKLTSPVARGPRRRRKTRKDKGKRHNKTKKHKRSRRYS